ncbi:MAG: manganese efflux pump MntP family protein [Bacteroidales bacterium]|jgi:putative Mn2+ efflux pump MntP|nr:manganese efflux pump MntP family protein [Bacteroidales bacterium]MCI2121223.1 manganese efflux pump MntP family protein [Bacteroidales bacterium]MCI2145987.1 manganese efflux pump MntP family protein [Bacteroidales bacterium]
MSYLELSLLAFALCFDTFAVTVAGGIVLPKGSTVWQKIRIMLFFALFQAGFTFIGWVLGSTVSSYIEKWDHWIAFVLLLYIGGGMIADGFKKNGGNSVNLLETGKLTLCSIATSIDALAVGISLAMLSLVKEKVIFVHSMIFIVTALSAACGLGFGRRIGTLAGKRSNLIGGIILIAIGIKILLQHTLLK